MSKKLEVYANRKILEYQVVNFKHPIRKTETHTPRILGQKTVGFNELIKGAKDRSATMGNEEFLKSQFECVMGMVLEHLKRGNAVNLDGYLRLQPFLKGSVEKDGRLSSKNKLVVRVSPLARLNLSTSDFSWRLKGDRVNRR